MALAVTHAKVDGIADDPNAVAQGLVVPSDWNAAHTLTGNLSPAQIDLTATYAWTGSHTYSAPITVQGGVYANQTTTGLALGVGAGLAKRNGATGSDDVFIGYLAGTVVADGQTHTTAVGAYAAAAMTTGAGATVFGQKAATLATSIQSSLAIGGKAGSALPTLESDTFVGYAAAQWSSATSAGRRVFVGYNAGQYDSGDYNIMIGYNAGPQQASPNNNPTTGDKNIGIGAWSLNNIKNVTQNTAIGYEALLSLVGFSSNTAVGYQAGRATTGFGNTFIGANAGTLHASGSRNIYIGISAGSTAPIATNNTFIAGADGNDFISNVYFGKGYSSTAPTGYTINGTRGSGTDIAGGNVTIAAGLSTGSAAPAKTIIASSTIGTTGTTAQTQITCATGHRGSLVAGPNTALATNATDGFLYIPGGLGTPTGTPTAQTGAFPMYWDSSNKKLYIYDGSWLGGTAPGVFS